MNLASKFKNLRIWVRLIILILTGTILSGIGLVHWATLQQQKIAVDQARDFAESVHQMTMAGLTGMMITGTIAQRNVFLDQIRDSNHIESLKVFRGEAVVAQFGAGRAGELPSTEGERSVLATGKTHHEVFTAPDGTQRLRAILPAVALENYLGKNCLLCHKVSPGTVLGAVSMEISLARAHETARKFGLSALSVAALLCLPLAFLIWYFISRIVTRPLYRMTTGLRRIAEGDIEEIGQLPQRGQDEVGQATDAFNQVMEKVRELLMEQRLSRIVFENSLEGITVTDAHGRIQMANQAFTETTGYRAEEVIGQTPALLQSGRQDAAFYQTFWTALKEKGEWRGEIWNKRKNGSIYPEWLNVSAVRDKRGEVEHYVGIFSDITERKQREEMIAHQAFHDALTGLPNRVLFLDRLEQALVQAKRSKSRATAVMFLDLDRFKLINDTLGHDAGDTLLREVAVRLRGCVRASDTVARMGGDEFTILLPEIGDHMAAQAVAQKILDAMQLPVTLAGQPTVITTSIGISMFPLDGRDADTLMKYADAAMYQVKGSGRASMCFFTPELLGKPSRRLELEAQLRQAIAQREFTLDYQDLVALPGGRVYGREAQLRWQDPVHGPRLPEEFLPLAIETGLILPIGEWLYTQACQQALQWQLERPGVVVAIHLSEPEFLRADLADVLTQALAHSGLAPALLEIEINEAMAMKDAARTESVVHAISRLGLRVVLDEFGSGQSNLLSLRRLAVTSLQIDRALVKHCTTDPDLQAVIKAIAASARALDLGLGAKGVETAAQLDQLRKLCLGPAS
jgi:diguanylate cyclase (GGDEF)-like protein/PAS domain S-box-containing protein